MIKPLSIQIGNRPIEGLTTKDVTSATPGTGTFDQALQDFAKQAIAPQQAAAKAVEDLAAGANGRIHESLLAVEKADISLRFLVTVRNRVVDAYHEVMRMGG